MRQDLRGALITAAVIIVVMVIVGTVLASLLRNPCA